MSGPTTPKLSVCVITYNHARYIRECLQSIVEQKTDFPFEVIVADDRSTDGTSDIVREFAERHPGFVKPILREANVGGTRNFVDLHNSATGMYVAHIDGDDLMLQGKLQKQVDFLDANSEFSAVWHRVNLFNDIGDFLPGEDYDLSSYPDGVVTLEHAFRLGSFAAHSSVMYRRSARKTVRAEFDMLDLFFAWEYLSAGKGKILPDVLGAYRVSAHGSAQLRNNTRILKLVAHHARYYLRLMPEQKRNIFVLAFINLMVDVRHFRASAWDFATLSIESASIVSPRSIWSTLSEMWRIPAYSPLGDVHLARSRKKPRASECAV